MSSSEITSQVRKTQENHLRDQGIGCDVAEREWNRVALQPSVFAWNSSPYFVVVLAADAEATRHASATTEAAAASAVRRGTDGMSHG